MSARPRIRRLHFQWKVRNREQTVASRCWNRPFWYGDGMPATEPSIIMRESDYRALLQRAGIQQKTALCSECGMGNPHHRLNCTQRPSQSPAQPEE